MDGVRLGAMKRGEKSGLPLHSYLGRDLLLARFVHVVFPACEKNPRGVNMRKAEKIRVWEQDDV